MTPSRRALAAVAAGVLLFAACGDDDDEALFDDDADESADDTTDAGSEPTDDTTDTSDDGDGPAPAGDFCDVVDELENVDDLEDSFTDPAAVESQISELRDIYEQGAELVPDEIADDYDSVHESLTTFADAFADADYNILDIQVSTITELESPDLEDATDRLEEFGETECGVDPSDGDEEEDDEDNAFDDIVDDLPEGATIRDGIVQQLTSQGISETDAQCIGDALEPSDLEDDAAISEHLETCGIDPDTGEPLDD